LFAEFAFPDSQDRRLAPEECDRRLADSYACAPDQVLADAMHAVRAASDRTAVIGAALWLMTGNGVLNGERIVQPRDPQTCVC
jgi:hypothetical protein